MHCRVDSVILCGCGGPSRKSTVTINEENNIRQKGPKSSLCLTHHNFWGDDENNFKSLDSRFLCWYPGRFTVLFLHLCENTKVGDWTELLFLIFYMYKLN